MPGDHQDLLEDLRRLRQRVELARVDAARHQVVARPFGRRLGQHRRLDLEEALLVEILPDLHRRAVAQHHVVLHARRGADRGSGTSAACPRTPAYSSAIGNGGVFASFSSADLARRDLDLAGLDLRVHRLGRARSTVPEHRDDVLRPQPLRRRRPAPSLSRATTCVMPWRSRMSMNTSEPRSRTRCTQPSSTTSLPTSSTRERAAGVGARELSERLIHTFCRLVRGFGGQLSRQRSASAISAEPSPRSPRAATDDLLPVCHVLDRHLPAGALVAADDGDERGRRAPTRT